MRQLSRSFMTRIREAYRGDALGHDASDRCQPPAGRAAPGLPVRRAHGIDCAHGALRLRRINAGAMLFAAHLGNEFPFAKNQPTQANLAKVCFEAVRGRRDLVVRLQLPTRRVVYDRPGGSA